MRSRSAKTILDEIDRVLAAHYGFTDEELDFIHQLRHQVLQGIHTETDRGAFIHATIARTYRGDFGVD